MGTGVRTSTLVAGVESVAVLVAGGHGRRTAPVALARCHAPILNRSSSAPKSLCAARRRHMTPYRVLVVQSSRPLRVAMGHMSDALRSRNSASLAPRPASERQERLDAGRCAWKKQPNVPGCLGWSLWTAMALYVACIHAKGGKGGSRGSRGEMRVDSRTGYTCRVGGLAAR